MHEYDLSNIFTNVRGVTKKSHMSKCNQWKLGMSHRPRIQDKQLRHSTGNLFDLLGACVTTEGYGALSYS